MLLHHHDTSKRTLTISSLLLTALLASCASPTKPPPNRQTITVLPAGKLSEKAKLEQQQRIIKIQNQTLAQLYKLKPQAQTEIEQSAGYGVFDINGLNVVLADAQGRGVVLDKTSGKTTYMRLMQPDPIPSGRIRPYRQVLIFSDHQKLAQFTADGLPVDTSGNFSIKVYQLNDKGVTLQTDWGARYFRDPDIN
ncbi:MAG: hypothetical protein U1F42_08405 [Candidatus Competibacteraceae bacterium]